MMDRSSESVKTEPSIANRIYLKRKELCPSHDLKYRYMCVAEGCEHRYLCNREECFDNHFHSGKLVLIRFNHEEFSEKFELAQRAIMNEENIVN